MSSAPTTSTPEAIAELYRSLGPTQQTSLLAFAQFLKGQEAQAAFEVVDEVDEAAWEGRLGDAAKAKNFARWADETRSREKPLPIDPARR